MASGSGKNQDDIQEPVHARCEESIAAAAVPAAEPPPHAPPVARVKVQAHGRPGVGGEGPSAAAAAAGEEEDDEASAAAAAAERKGQRAAYPSPTPSPSSCAGRGPPTVIPVVPVTGAGESSSVATVGRVGRAGVSRMELLVDDVPEMPGLQNLKAARDLDKRWAEKEALKQLIAQGDICSGETSNQQIAQGDICSGEASNQQIAQAESLNLQVAKGERSTVHSLGQHISTGIPQIPEEIQWLILLRLWPKDILRCQCVCLLWRRIGDSARFRSDHARHWSSTIPIFFHLPGFPWDHSLDLTATSIDLHGIDLAFRKSRSILHFPDILGHILDSDDSRSLHAQGCCSGIILLSYKDDLCACCPYSGNWRSLPPIHIKNVIMAFYTRAGVSPRDGDEFLLLYRTDEPPHNPHSFSIYSLGQDSTREIYCQKVLGSLTVLDKMLQQHPPVIQERAVSVGGMIYWLLHLEAPSGKNHLLAFSKDNEEFWLMSPPDLSGIYSHQLLQVKGQLALSVFNEGMTELGLWLHRGGPEEPWFHWKRISLPMDEIDANHGLERFGEPIVHIVSEELEFLADCPHILLQGNSEGGIVQQHGHTQHWCMTLPQSLEARLDVPAFLDKKPTPPFFRFVDT